LVEANDLISRPVLSPDGGMIAYWDGGSIYVVDHSRDPGVASEVSKVADGSTAEWLDEHTLIVTPRSAAAGNRAEAVEVLRPLPECPSREPASLAAADTRNDGLEEVDWGVEGVRMPEGMPLDELALRILIAAEKSRSPVLR
jgi:hypothetical protein